MKKPREMPVRAFSCTAGILRRPGSRKSWMPTMIKKMAAVKKMALDRFHVW
jgi:hypothetical protein